METRIKTRYGIIAYERAANFTLQESAFLSSAIKEAFEILNASYLKLSRGVIEEKTINLFFDKSDVLDDTLNLIIRKFKSRGIKCSREKAYSETPQSGSSVVLAMAVPEAEIKIYNAFFDRKSVKDNRAGVIIHEVAHLIGLSGEENRDADSAEITSAEAVKNFCLCACGKLSLDEIMREKERHSDSAELAYRTNPNRRENGEFDFGPDSGARSQSSGRQNGRSQNHDSQKSSGNYIDKLAESEQKLFRQNGIMFESDNVTTKLSDKKEDTTLPQFKLGFKHGGFGNSEIHVGKGDDFTGDPHEKDHIWGAFHAKLTGLKKNAKYTVIQDHKFRSKIWDSEECEFAEVVAAHEIQTDARGDAYLLRVGVTEAPVAMGNKEAGELKALEIAEIDLDLKLLEGPVAKHFEKVKKLGGYTNKVEYVIRHATLNNGGEVEKSIADKLGGKLIFSGRFVKDATMR